ncbi:MAG: DEAD/DEAH box helicase [Chitinophagaceae bacterium]|nr:DEAD/DEAH box helicase [Oligoflexus sp.]
MLKSALSPYFEAKTRDDGAAFYKARSIKAFFASEAGFTARVEDIESYQVSFEENGPRQWQPYCVCASAQKSGACRHIWAALLFLDGEGAKKPIVKQWLKNYKVEVKIKAWYAFALKNQAARAALPASLTESIERSEWKYFVRAIAHNSPATAPEGESSMRLALVVNAKRSRALDRLVFAVYTSSESPLKYKKSSISIKELEQFPHDRKLLDFFFDFEGFHGDPSYPRNVLFLSHLVFPREHMDEWLADLSVNRRFYASAADLQAARPMQYEERLSARFHYLTIPASDDRLKLDLELCDEGWITSCRKKTIEILCAAYALTARTLIHTPLLDERGKLWLKFIEDDLSIEAPDRDAFLIQVSDLLPLNKSEPEPSDDDNCSIPIPTLHFRQTDIENATECCGTLSFHYEEAVEGSSGDDARMKSRSIPRPNRVLEQTWIETLSRFPDIQTPRLRLIAFPSQVFPSLVSQLIELGWAVYLDKRPLSVSRPEVSVVRSFNWLELSVEMDEVTIDLAEFAKTMKKHSTFLVTLSDGSSRFIEPKTLKTLEKLSALLQKRDDRLVLDPAQTPLLEQLVMSLPGQTAPAFVIDYRQALKDAHEATGIAPSPSFIGTLRPYQLDGLSWLFKMTRSLFGVCLADEMGLGKTVQILALLDLRQKDGCPSLIIMPRSLIGNWQAEIAKFAPKLKVLDFASSKRTAEDFKAWDIVLTTYGVLLRDSERLSSVPWQHVILDEAQVIKNNRTQCAQAAQRLKAQYRVALSGTPLENNTSELVSLFRFLNPGLLGPSVESALLHRTHDAEGLALLARGLRPLILRRSKEDVIVDLPPKIVNILYCEMDKGQKKIYAQYNKHYRARIQEKVDEGNFSKSKLLILEAMLRLRQIACHPSLVDPDAHAIGNAKIDILMEKLEEVGDSKVLVFSQFTSFLHIIEERLKNHAIAYEYLDGKTRNRTERVAHFQSNPDIKVFLISLKAGGVGLNLTAARYAFIMDPWWNPAVEEQAMARAHRIGQTKEVIAYKIVVRNSIEEKILLLQNQKHDLVHDFMEGEEETSLLKVLNPDDLDRLMS